MSNECSTIVWKRDFGSMTRKLIAARLADHADDEGRGIWPSVERISAQCNTSPRTVQRTLADFVSEGVLIIVDEGGRGRGNTRRYDFDMVKLQAMQLAIWGSKGDTVTPLENAKGDTDDAKGDTDDSLGCHGDTQTTKEPPIEPSDEREARERDAENDLKKSFNRTFKHHPTFKGSEKEPAFKLWCELTDDDRTAAETRMPALVALWAGQRRKHPPMPVKTIRDRIWQDVEAEAAQAQAAPCIVKPFGKVFAVIRMADLLAGPGRLPPMPATLQKMVEQGGPSAERERMAHQARHGFAKVNHMHETAQRGTGWHLRDDDRRFADAGDLAESIEVGSDVWNAWQAEHERRGWPWVPDLGNRQWFYFPVGGPDGLTKFLEQLRQLETSDDA